MTDDKILETIPNIKCIFGCEEAVILAYMPEGCVCFPDDKWQWLCAQHWQSAEPLGSAYAAPDEFLKPIAELKRAAFTAYRAVSDDAKDAARWRAYLQSEYGRIGQGQTFDKFRKDWNDHHDAMMGEPIDAAMAKESEGE